MKKIQCMQLFLRVISLLFLVLTCFSQESFAMQAQHDGELHHKKDDQADLVCTFSDLYKKWGAPANTVEKTGREDLDECNACKWLMYGSLTWIPAVSRSMLSLFGSDRLNVGCVVFLNNGHLSAEQRAMYELPPVQEEKLQIIRQESESIITFCRRNKIVLHHIYDVNNDSIKTFITLVQQILAEGKSVIVCGDLVGHRIVVLFTCYLISRCWDTAQALGFVTNFILGDVNFLPEWEKVIDNFEATLNVKLLSDTGAT